jgi:hypothetical protein
MMRYDIHAHTRHSDGVNTPLELVAHAKKLGLSGIAVTDHNTVAGGLEALKHASEGFRVIPGLEVSSLEGHILVLGVKEDIPKKTPAAEVIERAHALGGVAIAAHPYDVLRGGVGDLIFTLKFDAIEVCNGRTLLERRSARKAAETAGLRTVGGSDAHSLRELGSVTVASEDDILEAIRTGNVRIQAKVDKLALIAETLKRRLAELLP